MPPPPLPPPESTSPSKSQTSGFAVGAGIGYQFPVIGAELIYYVQLGDNIRIAPYAGAGIAPTTLGTLVGYAVGMMVIFGGRHRGLIDISYGLAAWEGKKDLATDTVLELRSVYGVTIAGGYEFMADGGFFVRPSAGATFLTSERRSLDEDVAPTFCVALGYKFF